VCTAQHADDQIETFWLQLTRGAGMKGLAGMQVLSNQVFRPFLKWHKQDLLRAAQELDLKWREDQSNNSLVYRRNLWRKQLLPDLEKQIPDLKASTLLLQNYFSKEVTAQTQALDTYQNQFNYIPGHRFYTSKIYKTDNMDEVPLSSELDSAF
jgi:tRNA(Ile)-lysidine synthase